MHSNAFQCIAELTQPLFECILSLKQYPYDPGTLVGSANQCILGNEYLRSNLLRKATKVRVSTGSGTESGSLAAQSEWVSVARHVASLCWDGHQRATVTGQLGSEPW